ncbi:sulfotransferase family protein [Flavobacterium phycosphaerae]|uniref:sulfotransferase n=1 Tax=Flavobacterium phycosphaerae TaxID=2697515 RepID=UPI00138A6B89|nr:sulfotransferase [Flavobacterium phycosphaerae]
MKHVILLSCKSSGSTALQNYLKENLGYKTISFTQHQEEETLYWSKVASVLKMPQNKMYRSKVPYTVEKAVKDLNEFFLKNKLAHINITKETTEKEFQEYYFELIQSLAPKFIEKSPHHLYNESNLVLIKNFVERYKNEVDIRIIGLIRHPQSVLLSGWKRWQFLPSGFQNEWNISYKNLLDWKEKLNITFCEYEKLVSNEITFDQLIGETAPVEKYRFNSKSMNNWMNNKDYGFQLSNEVIATAKRFGYTEFKTLGSLQWKITIAKASLLFSIKSLLKKLKS